MWTLNDITAFIDNKIAENEDIIKITFFELRVKYNRSESETLSILHLVAIKLENMNYKIYRTGEYIYCDKKYNVESNELLVAIKNKEKIKKEK